MKNKKKKYVKIQIPAGKANPSPPIGPILGQRGINIMEFCKKFNKKTKKIEKGTKIPVIIKIYNDKSFKFTIKKPTISFMIKQKLNIQKGSQKPKKKIIGTLNMSQIIEIEKNKNQDMTGKNKKKNIKSIIGTAKSMGIKIKNEKKI